MRRPRTLAGRLFAWQITVVLVVLATLGIVLDRVLEREAVESLTRSLVQEARTVAGAVPDDPAQLQPAVASLGASAGVRITIIRTDGVVLADSRHDPATMENHLDRPEVREALRGTIGTSSRSSATIGIAFRYVALPPQNGFIVRVALPLTRVEDRSRTVRLALLAGFLVAALATAVGALLVARGVSRPVKRATEPLARLGEGDLSARMETDGGPRELAVLASTVNRMAERLEEQLRRGNEERRTRDLILSSMREGILLARSDGGIGFANDAFERLLGPEPASAQGLAPVALREAARDASQRRTTVPVEFETGAPSRWLRGAAIPVGEDGSVLLVLRDVTNAKRLDAVRRDFVANASHELKTPAASIMAAAETIRRAISEDPAVVPRFAGQLERETARLSRIVSDLLDLSRLETGSELTELVRLDDLVRRELAASADDAARAEVSLEHDLAQVPAVRGSERDLSLLVRNLVDNAIRYTRQGGRVRVELHAEAAETVLRVTDTGVGIPGRELSRVFERFYRVDRARSRETGGTGLGLSIVKHVAENHGGGVRAESELGQGSMFEIRLPIVTGAHDDTAGSAVTPEADILPG